MATPPYASAEDFANMGLPGNLFRDLGSDIVTQAIAWASDTADGYFRKRYALPLVGSVTADIKRAVVAIAQYDLMSRRGFKPESGSDSMIVTRYDNAIAWLLDVSRGTVELGMADSSPDSDEAGTLAVSAAPVSMSYNTPPTGDSGYDFDPYYRWR